MNLCIILHSYYEYFQTIVYMYNIKVHRSSFDLLHVSSICALRTSEVLRSFGAFSACLRISLFHNAKPLSVDLLLSDCEQQQ